MRNKISIARIPYIVFELISINIEDYAKSSGYVAEQIETVYLAVLPEQINYRLQSRDAISQTYEDVFQTKFAFAPERCRLSGTFGDKHRYIAGTLMDGWDRLKQFQEDIVKASKKAGMIDNDAGLNTEPNKGGLYIHAVNYYDFIFQKFGTIDINTWQVSGNALVNTNLIRYDCEFSIIGDLILSDSKDPLLASLNALFGEEGSLLSEITDGINDILGSDTIYEITSTIGAVTGTMDAVFPLLQSVFSVATNVSRTVKQGYRDVVSMI